MNIIEQIKAIEHEQLDAWTDIRMVGRGYGIVDNVSRIVAAEDCVSARVRGGSLYVTSVFVDAQGNVDSRCTCPVRTRCKHDCGCRRRCAAFLESGPGFQGLPLLPKICYNISHEAYLYKHSLCQTSLGDITPVFAAAYGNDKHYV